MPEYERQQSQTQNSHLAGPARPDRANSQPVSMGNPLMAQQGVLGNQTMQCLLNSRVIQAKPAINELPSSTLTSFASAQTGLQRKCACGGTLSPDGECAECRRKRLASSSSPEHRRPLTQSTVSLFETGEGTETLHGEPSGTMAADGGGAPAASCGVTGSFSKIPNGVMTASFIGSKLGASFDMIADFTATAIPCSCSCGEYRQYVRGVFKKNGTTVVHRLCANTLDPTTYHEDCATVGGTDYRYGYRSIPFASSKFTSPDQATGCRFEGYDAPGIVGASGDRLQLSLDFYADLVDTCRGMTLTGSAWSVIGDAIVP
jgi:hypothetical protein